MKKRYILGMLLATMVLPNLALGQAGMAPAEVVDILGEATLDEPSLHRLIDRVLTYRGKRVSSGERVLGKIKFRRGKLVEIESPEF